MCVCVQASKSRAVFFDGRGCGSEERAEARKRESPEHLVEFGSTSVEFGREAIPEGIRPYGPDPLGNGASSCVASHSAGGNASRPSPGSVRPDPPKTANSGAIALNRCSCNSVVWRTTSAKSSGHSPFRPPALSTFLVDSMGVARTQGMYIVAADGKTENSEISSLLRSPALERFTLLIRRPKKFVASFERNGLPLGLVLRYDTCGDTVLVVDVDAAGAAGKHLCAGDRIALVNGRGGSAATLLAELKAAEKLELGVIRL